LNTFAKIIVPALFCCGIGLIALPISALGQGASVAFGGLKHEASLPIEVTADTLNIDQAKGTASFSGSVVAGQGELRIGADSIDVEYAVENGNVTGRINRMVASGNVTLTNGGEAAEAARAVYVVASGTIEMSGNVLLTQGQNALAGEALSIDLGTGQAKIEGRVRTIFQSGGN
jgi:lipopolysaccharide export system protein LptA